MKAGADVDAAVAAPEREPIELLADKQRALGAAEHELEQARAAYDADGEALAMGRAAVLRQHVERLRVLAAAELDRRGEAAARDWLAGHAGRCRDLGERITGVQGRALKLLEQLVAAIAEEGRLRATAGPEALGAELLSLRWPALGQAGPPTLPPLMDVGTPVLRAADAITPRVGLRVRDSVLSLGGDTPEVARRRTLEGLHKFWSSEANRAALPEAVRTIVEQAGIPAPEWTPEQQAARAARDERRRGRGETVTVLRDRP